ncbi:hypothetical protein [Halomonas alimentaria]|uniref:hypothetical protein n=1 Tax=Halomonas alimentaria TaxID=147248 RepID=UPI002490C489|nr:hypothetical protein [Halomonas alimentaria]
MQRTISPMLGKLFGRQPIWVWSIKQADEELLHLVGRGTLESDMKPKKLRAQLLAGQYRGGIRIRDTGMVLNSHLLEAMAPEEEFWLDDTQNTALWQGKRWRLAWVPQRSWHYEGRLVAEPDPVRGGDALVSVEDVSSIRRRANTSALPNAKVVFRPVNENEHAERELRASIEEAQRSRRNSSKGWRKDGSWGLLDGEAEELKS